MNLINRPPFVKEAYGYPIFCYDKDGNHGLVGLRFDDIFESHVPEESNIRLFVNVLPQIRKIASKLAIGLGLYITSYLCTYLLTLAMEGSRMEGMECSILTVTS